MRCILLDIEMKIGKKCPSEYNLDGFNCYVECGFSESLTKRGEKMVKKRRRKRLKYVVIDLPDEDLTTEEKIEKNKKTISCFG